MKSSTRLESAVFQLTPTRTRFDLVIVANGKSEKIASGLINPFLAHLKSARDQFAKGGYSIVLKPESGSDSESWFTKDTVERFVRFVNTPVVLERVHILESEIKQIEKAITIQTQNDIHSSKVEIVHSKPAEHTQGFMEEDKGLRPIPNVNEEKAIVLYEPSNLADEETTVYLSEENSKVQLVKVLETRKSFLQKEQKMAFARALASGFDINHMSPLVSFAECFTASRFMDACTRFIKIWKTKNDIRQWLETEGADSVSSPLDYTVETEGIMLSGVAGNEMNLMGPLPESAVEPGPNNNSSHQPPTGSQNHVHGQFAPSGYPPWGLISPPGFPVFQGYPVQGMPYYPGYPGHGPFTYPPFQSPDDLESVSHGKKIQKGHSFEANGINKSDSRMADEEKASPNKSDLEDEASDSKGSHRKTRSSKKKSGTVVIRNINYITAKRQKDSESESPSNTDNDSDKDFEDTSVTKSNTRQRRYTAAVDLESSLNGQLGDKESSAGHWHAFQNCLMRSSDDNNGTDHALFSMEKGAKTKPHLTGLDKDPLADNAHHQSPHGASVYLNPSGYSRGMQKASQDELLRTNIGNHGRQGIYEEVYDVQVAERNRSVIRHQSANDNFMVQRQLNQPNYTMSPADMSSINISANGTQKVTDDSFILPSRPIVRHEDQTAKIDGINMNYDLPSSHPDTENCGIRSQETYEPEDLGWIAERGAHQDSAAYNGVIDYEMEVNITRNVQGNSQKDTGSNKKDSIQKPKVASGTLENKRSIGPIKRGKPSKMSPIEEARARAEKLRSFKADLQKQKKEKEEEQKKRIEALKVERQKRIVARSNVAPAKSVQPSPQTRKQLLEKASPGSLKDSKFCDLEPGFSSPLQGVSRRTLSMGAIESRKAPKPKSNAVTPSSVNKVNKSVSSLSELKKGEESVTPEPKASMSRIRRLSEPRKGSSHISPSRRYNGTSVAKENTSSGPERKKVSARVNLNKTKTATLPDLRMRKPETDTKTDDDYSDKSIIKQMTNSGNQPDPAHIPVDAEVGNNKVVIQQSVGYVTSAVEKNTATLEYENSNVTQVANNGNLPSAHTPVSAGVENNKVVVQKCAGDATSGVENNIDTPVYEKHALTDEHCVKEVTGSQECNNSCDRVMTTMTNVNGEPGANKSKVQVDAYEVTKSTVKKDLSKFSVCEAIEPYQAPYARVSSLEEPCTRNSEYGKATPIPSNEKTSLSVAATHASTAQLKFESVPEASEKPWVKEPSKGGFKRLLKFGKKSVPSSSDHNSEMDSITRASSEGHQCSTNGTSSSQAPTLKNLISHDDTEIASTPPPKSSRHFSLLSPFRKSSEKKIIIL